MMTALSSMSSEADVQDDGVAVKAVILAEELPHELANPAVNFVLSKEKSRRGLRLLLCFMTR
jgi:hypothetical protein